MFNMSIDNILFRKSNGIFINFASKVGSVLDGGKIYFYLVFFSTQQLIGLIETAR